MKNLIDYHIRETERRFNEVNASLSEIKNSLEEIKQFKTESVVTARWVSMVVSAVCGLVTLIATTIINIKFK